MDLASTKCCKYKLMIYVVGYQYSCVALLYLTSLFVKVFSILQ